NTGTSLANAGEAPVLTVQDQAEGSQGLAVSSRGRTVSRKDGGNFNPASAATSSAAFPARWYSSGFPVAGSSGMGTSAICPRESEACRRETPRVAPCDR